MVAIVVEGRLRDLPELVADEDDAFILRRSPRVCAFFNANAIFFNHSEMAPDEHYPVIIRKDALIDQYSLRSGNSAGTLGAFSYLYTERDVHNVAFGRYCSVGSDLVVFGERHPIEWVTTSNITYSFQEGLGKAHFARAHRDLMGSRWRPLAPPDSGVYPVVEHDVWIGQGAMLGRNIRIGTGAVIGAGAVVTKDVKPYMIVAGNPAREIRRRFADHIVARLLASRWWDVHPDCLFLFQRDDPERFLDQLDHARTHNEIASLPVRTFSAIDIVHAIEASIDIS